VVETTKGAAAPFVFRKKPDAGAARVEEESRTAASTAPGRRSGVPCVVPGRDDAA
jgi:hypothetical protein